MGRIIQFIKIMVFLLVLLVSLTVILDTFTKVYSENKTQKQESYNKICEDMGLKLLSVSKELLSQDAVFLL